MCNRDRNGWDDGSSFWRGDTSFWDAILDEVEKKTDGDGLGQTLDELMKENEELNLKVAKLQVALMEIEKKVQDALPMPDM